MDLCCEKCDIVVVVVLLNQRNCWLGAAEFFRSFQNLEIKVMSLACVCVRAPDPASLTHQFWNPLAFQFWNVATRCSSY